MREREGEGPGDVPRGEACPLLYGSDVNPPGNAVPSRGDPPGRPCGRWRLGDGMAWVGKREERKMKGVGDGGKWWMNKVKVVKVTEWNKKVRGRERCRERHQTL